MQKVRALLRRIKKFLDNIHLAVWLWSLGGGGAMTTALYLLIRAHLEWVVLIGCFSVSFLLIIAGCLVSTSNKSTETDEPFSQPAARTPDSCANRTLPIEILTPLNYGEVSFRRAVSGSVHPALSLVQVWVFAGDGLWYRQNPVKVDGCLWSVECQFGSTPVMEKPSGDYQIIAIADAKIREDRLTILPDVGMKSEIIKVRRTRN